MNIAQHVERASTHNPDTIAILFEGAAWTYAELEAQAGRCANALRALGVQAGDRVALFLPNLPEFIVAYLGALKLGAIAVSVNAQLKQPEVEFLLRDSGAGVIVTAAILLANVPRGQVESLRHIIVVGDSPPDCLGFAALLEQADPVAPARAMQPDSPAVIVYSSGTTGFPKGVVLSHRNVIFTMESKQRYCGMRADDRMLLFVPLFHCFGQNAVLNSAFHVGATVVLHRGFDIQRVIGSISADGVTMLFGVPTFFIVLLQRATPADLRSVRYCFSAAAPLPPEIAAAWQQTFGMVINEGYGLTETSPFASYNHEVAYRLGSIGTPIEQVAMKLVDPESGAEVAAGERGEIAISGPNVMLGYWNRPEETSQVLADGWFRSGDMGRVDDQGYFYLVDRLKDMINVSGLKVYPTEVEHVLYQHPAVGEAAVYGVPDSFTGESVRASIVLKPGQRATEAEIIAYCRRRIAAFKIPVAVAFVDALPKNATGKVLRRVLAGR
jgi:long-chain acyl-CoA synthetase